MKKIIIFLLVFSFGFPAYSQNIGQLVGQLGETILLKQIIDNPNLQSADMKNYLAFLNAGHNSYNNGKYAEAMSHYSEASKIISSTNDQNLRKLYNNYGWAKVLNDSYNNAYAQYKLTNPSLPQTGSSNSYSNGGYSSGSVGTYSGGTVNNYSSGTTTSSKTQKYQKTAHPRKCVKCLGRGTCGMCHGKGTYYVMAGKNSRTITCPHCSGTGKCQVCMGSGTNGVDYY